MPKGDGVSLTSARWLALEAVINSEEGKAAMLDAIKAGNPPLCGVDALLASIIIDYRDENGPVLQSAGSLVAECMKSMGYVQGSLKTCPTGCTVGRATVFTQPATSR